MGYHYHESTHISRENATALRSLSATGELPTDRYWTSLARQHDAHPARFDRGNPVLAALLDRNELQHEGKLAANAPLLPQGGLFAEANRRHTLNAARFDHYHPFLGGLIELRLPTGAAAGQGLLSTTTPGTSGSSFLPSSGPTGTSHPGSPGDSLGHSGNNGTSSGGANSGGTSSGGTTSGNFGDPVGVPEPTSAVLVAIALAVAVIVARVARRAPKPARAALV